MRESIWGYMIIVLGVLGIFFIYFFQNVTNTNDHNYELLKETTKAAMYDAVDLATYRKDGIIKIESEKFIENFIRRFAENANLSQSYKIDIYDINEVPPKVSIVVSSSQTTNITGQSEKFDIVNRIDAILETPYEK